MKQSYFITGIGTEVGKTMISAIVTQALEADYWKPIQAGDLEYSDTHKIQNLISNKKTKFHLNAFALKTPMSPHAAAEIDGVAMTSENILRPQTENNLVIEGAGGLLVPINETQTIADLMQPADKVILVSRHYLGSINHTLLSLEALFRRGLNCFGIIYSGNETKTTEDIITKMSGVPVIGRVEEEEEFTAEIIKKYADKFRENLINK
ncbi:dethiobiotin synthase [Zunongwangia pacifica]|uniref:ATP-dependent dethiobiotin synthetase BioD n=1 Tax=Zunongwangia pacifica TaxID=2911062 RepID=A0A9X1ZWS5_9FLAO|nr:dethiobiotin synthase [Zunongwangia pacifica]MCL6218795.1 dethiobiotin synthase [Zunongwangia pacifica]